MKGKIIGIVIAVVVLAAAVIGGGWYFKQQSKPVITSSQLLERLEDASELTVEKMYYTGIEEFEEGTVPLITKNSFFMKYEAVISAGFDMEDVDIDITDEQVIVQVPKAKVLSVAIDANTIEYFDTKFSLIKKTDRKEATKQVQIQAQKSAEEHANDKGLLDEADKRAEVIFKGILEGGTGGREIIVEHKKG
ncbi:MAG: DUF4230 domain-containing protein [Mogibacterium sp.]|nr:DUF4230 domain-containing protein [Mogibacterium sp.]